MGLIVTIIYYVEKNTIKHFITLENLIPEKFYRTVFLFIEYFNSTYALYIIGIIGVTFVFLGIIKPKKGFKIFKKLENLTIELKNIWDSVLNERIIKHFPEKLPKTHTPGTENLKKAYVIWWIFFAFVTYKSIAFLIILYPRGSVFSYIIFLIYVLLFVLIIMVFFWFTFALILSWISLLLAKSIRILKYLQEPRKLLVIGIIFIFLSIILIMLSN